MFEIPCRVSLDLRAHEAAEQPETTEAEEAEAVASIIEDFLLCGQMYPPKGGRHCVSTGEYLFAALSQEDIESLLTAIVDRNQELLADKSTDLIGICRDELPGYLREKHAELIERRVAELQPDKDEL